MMAYGKLLKMVLSGRADANIRFDELRNLLTRLGFEERSRGSHHIFVRPGVEELINLRKKDTWLSRIRFGRCEAS